ncbi:tetratricopeptide repeat protein [Candidatus Margulisiibacteriota bacterium]
MGSISAAGENQTFSLKFSLFGNGKMEKALAKTSVSPAACGSAEEPTISEPRADDDTDTDNTGYDVELPSAEPYIIGPPIEVAVECMSPYSGGGDKVDEIGYFLDLLNEECDDYDLIEERIVHLIEFVAYQANIAETLAKLDEMITRFDSHPNFAKFKPFVLYGQAGKLFTAGNLDEAREIYFGLLEEYGTLFAEDSFYDNIYHHIYITIGQTYYAEGNYAEAINYYNQHLTNIGGDANVYLALGEINLRLGLVNEDLATIEAAATNYQQALDYLDCADPDGSSAPCSQILYDLAITSDILSRTNPADYFDLAVENYQLVIDHFPETWRADRAQFFLKRLTDPSGDWCWESFPSDCAPPSVTLVFDPEYNPEQQQVLENQINSLLALVSAFNPCLLNNLTRIDIKSTPLEDTSGTPRIMGRYHPEGKFIEIFVPPTHPDVGEYVLLHELCHHHDYESNFELAYCGANNTLRERISLQCEYYPSYESCSEGYAQVCGALFSTPFAIDPTSEFTEDHFLNMEVVKNNISSEAGLTCADTLLGGHYVTEPMDELAYYFEVLQECGDNYAIEEQIAELIISLGSQPRTIEKMEYLNRIFEEYGSDPNFYIFMPFILFSRGKALGMWGFTDEAVASFNRILNEYGDLVEDSFYNYISDNYLVEFGYIYFNAGDTPENNETALRYFDDALRQLVCAGGEEDSLACPLIYIHKGLIHERLGQTGLAITNYQMVVDYYPDSGHAIRAQGYLDRLAGESR